MPGKRGQFEAGTWQALDLLARDRMMDFQELADEAFRDLLKKHNRPTDLKAALRQSAGVSAEVHELRSKRKREKPQKGRGWRARLCRQGSAKRVEPASPFA